MPDRIITPISPAHVAEVQTEFADREVRRQAMKVTLPLDPDARKLMRRVCVETAARAFALMEAADTVAAIDAVEASDA